MDALNLLFSKAEEEGVISSFHGRQDIPHRLSVYADDVILFLHASRSDAQAAKRLLDMFGDASGLKCNMGKSSISPILCDEEFVVEISSLLNCQVVHLPILYLGLPLHFKIAPKKDFQALIDKIRKRLAMWTTDMLTQAGRLILVQSVLSAMAIFHLMSLDPPPWVFKAIDKIRRAFLWKGTETVQEGHYLVNWKSVCQPKSAGGLEIMSLEAMSSSLSVRRVWTLGYSDFRPWHILASPLNDKDQDIFNAATAVVVGNGNGCSFWSDKWLNGKIV